MSTEGDQGVWVGEHNGGGIGTQKGTGRERGREEEMWGEKGKGRGGKGMGERRGGKEGEWRRCRVKEI